jgi:short-subunit dehydrogenase
MVRRGAGHIVNVASGAGLAPRPGMTPYAAVKHAVIGLTTSLRAEAAAYGVRVSAVCPGYVATGIFTATRYVGVDAATLRRAVPLKPTTPEACARATLRGVARNRAIIPVGYYVWLDWLGTRICPETWIKLSSWRAARFRAARVTK